MTHTNMLWTRLTALSLAIAGVCFALYPAIRPYTDESTLRGAEAFASPAWFLAHSSAMVGFILLTLGLLGLYSQFRETAAGRLGITALVVIWIGVGLTLPYYGAETFALRAVGQEALRQNNVDLLVTITNSFRFGPGVWFFGPGLLAIAVGAILFAIAIWRSGVLTRWSGIPLAAGLALFLPQFYTPPSVRIGHGLLVAIGCWVIAWGLASRRKSIDSVRLASQQLRSPSSSTR